MTAKRALMRALLFLLSGLSVCCESSRAEVSDPPTAVVASERSDDVTETMPETVPDAGSPNVRPNAAGGSVPTAEADGLLRVTSIERYGAKQSARIVVHLTRAPHWEVGELDATADQGPRLYVDIKDAQYAGPLVYEVGGLVMRVRLGEQPSGLRLVLDLQQRGFRRIFYLPEPSRLLIDVSRHPPRSNWGVQRGERSLRRVVLDPGHGGRDPGAIGISGLHEKDVALDLAHRAGPLIARELGVDTLLTRDDDTYVPLDERVAKANAFGADLFISIHCNASESQNSHGVMSFVLDHSRDADATRIAARENAASSAATRDFATSMRQVIDAATVRTSVQFAQLLQRASTSSLGAHYPGVSDGGVRRAGFFVLAGAHMPAVLFEASFISNPTEEERLGTPQYRQKLADGIVNAIRAYRDGR